MLLTLPVSANTLVPLLFSVPIAANQCAAVEDDLRDVREGLDVVEDCRLLPQPLMRRERRARPRHAALALDRGHQRRLLAADERARAQRRSRCRSRSPCRGCPCPAARTRAPAAIARSAARSPAGTPRGCRCSPGAAPMARAAIDHPLDHRVRVALEHRAVHERARIALVGVADRRTSASPRLPRRTSTSARSGSRRRRGRAGPDLAPPRPPARASSPSAPSPGRSSRRGAMYSSIFSGSISPCCA